MCVSLKPPKEVFKTYNLFLDDVLKTKNYESHDREMFLTQPSCFSCVVGLIVWIRLGERRLKNILQMYELTSYPSSVSYNCPIAVPLSAFQPYVSNENVTSYAVFSIGNVIMNTLSCFGKSCYGAEVFATPSTRFLLSETPQSNQKFMCFCARRF